MLKFVSLLPLFLALASGQTPPDVDKRLAALEAATKSAQSAGDNAWMLVSAALVLLMTGPGLALFYGGLVRRKNVLSTMMHSFILMSVVTVIWFVIGYSMTFGEWNAFVGGGQFAFLHGVGAAPNADYAPTIPQQTFMVYQLMFAIITPALISGAFAERMKFSGMLLFSALWSLIVYFPDGAYGVGQRRAAQRDAGRKDSVLRFRRWHGGAHHVGSLGAGVRAVSRAAQRLSRGPDAAAQHGAERRRAPACCGWAGSDSMRGARLRRRRSPPALSWRRISARPRRRSAGCSLNGSGQGSRAYWAPHPARSRDWSPSLPHPASSSPGRRC